MQMKLFSLKSYKFQKICKMKISTQPLNYFTVLLQKIKDSINEVDITLDVLQIYFVLIAKLHFDWHSVFGHNSNEKKALNRPNCLFRCYLYFSSCVQISQQIRPQFYKGHIFEMKNKQTNLSNSYQNFTYLAINPFEYVTGIKRLRTK